MKYALLLLPLLFLSCRKNCPIDEERLTPPEGIYNYRFTTQELNTPFKVLNEVFFQLLVDGNGSQTVKIQKIGTSDFGANIRDYNVPDSCRAKFNGNSSIIGTFKLGSFKPVCDLIPVCMDSRSIEALADLIYVLRIQGTNFFGINNLNNDNDSRSSEGFRDSWASSPYILAWRHINSGSITARKKQGDNNLISWTSGKMQTEMLFTGASNGNYFYSGNSFTNLELEIERSGVLRMAKSTLDSTNLDMWVETNYTQIPPKSEYPQKAPDLNVMVSKTWLLERL